MKKIFASFLALALMASASAQVVPAKVTQRGDGYHIGTAPAQQIGFNGATPTVQRTSITEAYAGAATGTLTLTANPAAADTITVGSTTYTFKTSLTGAANQILIGATVASTGSNIVAAEMAEAGAGSTYGTGTTANASAFASPGATVAASSTLTSNNTAPTAGDTVTIGGTTYRFESTLAAIGDVKIGTADATLLSLAKTILGTGVAGTDMFTGTPANTQVTSSSSVTSHTITITALTAGADGNAIATTATGATLSFTGSTLASGTSAITFTAAAAGTAGNSVATTYSSTAATFGATTLGSGTASPSATQNAVLLNELRDSLVQKGLIKGSD